MSGIPLILFAKVPQAGKVKTRLLPELSSEQAMGVARVLLLETLKLTTENWPGKIILALWPNVEDVFIQECLDQYNVDVVTQSPGDLGEKMFNAMEFAGYPCAVMGCDVPHLCEAELVKAYDFLEQGKHVLGPTYDGGYYLMGLQAGRSSLFEKQSWGDVTVLEASLTTALREKFEFQQLATMTDIDHYSDLVQASAKLESLQFFVK